MRRSGRIRAGRYGFRRRCAVLRVSSRRRASASGRGSALSPSLDSIGPIAPTVECCARIDAVLAGEEVRTLDVPDLSRLRLGVLQGYVLEGLEGQVAGNFSSAISLLSSLGAQVQDVHFAGLDRIAVCNQKGGIAAAEAYAWHRRGFERDFPQYDPRVLSRLLRGKEMSAADYLDLLKARRETIAEAAIALRDFDAVLLPTLPGTAPQIAFVEGSDEAYFERECRDAAQSQHLQLPRWLRAFDSVPHAGRGAGGTDDRGSRDAGPNRAWRGGCD